GPAAHGAAGATQDPLPLRRQGRGGDPAHHLAAGSLLLGQVLVGRRLLRVARGFPQLHRRAGQRAGGARGEVPERARAHAAGLVRALPERGKLARRPWAARAGLITSARCTHATTSAARPNALGHLSFALLRVGPSAGNL